MNGRSRPVIHATLAMIGTIIGAGIFAIPPMFARTGLVAGSIVFWVIALAVLATHLLFVEVIARDPVRRRLPGYVSKALGESAGWITLVTVSAQYMGALLAYLLLGGGFVALLVQQISGLSLSFGPFSLELVLQLVFWVAASYCVVRGLKIMARVEAALTWALIVTIGIVILAALPYTRFLGAPESHVASIFAPLGIFLFALFGLSAIPEVHEVAGRKINLTRGAVFIGTLAAALITWLFGLAYYAVQNSQAQGIIGPFDGVFTWLVPIMGFLAVITSYLTIGFDLQASFIHDIKLKPVVAQAIALGGPLLLLILGARNFLATVDIVGSIFTAANGALAVLVANRLMSKDRQPPNWGWRVALPLVTALILVVTVFQKVTFILTR